MITSVSARPLAGGWSKPACSAQEVFDDPQKADAFVDDYLHREAHWYAIARDPVTFLTRDGYAINPTNGAPTPDFHNFSAPSKESLDIGLCVKALEGNPQAAVLLGNGDAGAAREAAARILAGKIDSFEKWYHDWPGYGGFMPWFTQTPDKKGTQPTPDWLGHCPGLDNGEWAWSMLLAERELRRQGYEDLANRYGQYNHLLRVNVTRMFYDARAGRIRGDVRITDPRSVDTKWETIYGADGKGEYLTGEHGIHEGQMLLLYATLLGKDMPADASARIWGDVHMKRIEHADGTTWQGFWGSAHESWAYLFLPYRDIPQFRDLFRIREEIRANNAAERGYPGLAASINAPDLKSYDSDCGIENIGTQPVTHNNVFTPYGAFPMLLQFAGQSTHNYGLAWLVNMLNADHMYGPIGGLESATNDGQQSAMLKTCDGSLPNLLALSGGLEHEAGDMLREMGVYDRFVQIMTKLYADGMGREPLREPHGFVLPPHAVPPARWAAPAMRADRELDRSTMVKNTLEKWAPQMQQYETGSCGTTVPASATSVSGST